MSDPITKQMDEIVTKVADLSRRYELEKTTNAMLTEILNEIIVVIDAPRSMSYVELPRAVHDFGCSEYEQGRNINAPIGFEFK